LGSAQAALFVRTEGGVFAPLAYEGPNASTDLDSNHPIIQECWRGTIRLVAKEGEAPSSPVLTAFPLRLGTEPVAVLLYRAETGPSEEVARAVQEELDQRSLPLATALAFEEVRTLVTEDERHRLAREIHDGVAQEVASLGYVLDEIAANADDSQLALGLRELRGELSRIVTELRFSIFDLRTEVAESAGLGSALSDYVRRVGARSSMTVHLTLDEGPGRLSPGVETELFRITQEAITNARKHSHAENLWVDCWVRPPSARILVRDDGRGLGGGRPDSYGLRIMRERAEGISADVRIDPYRGTDDRPGTCVSITLGKEAHPGIEAAS
jgi:signal transduction histidine kinase